MEAPRATKRRLWRQDRGFSLPELLIAIALMGVVLAIATSVWSNTVQSRRIDSATNQIKGDLELAHSSATNRLSKYRIVVSTTGSAVYEFGPSGGSLTKRTLPDGITVTSTSLEVVEFLPSGEVAVYTSKANGKPDETCKPPELVVKASNGDPAYSVSVDCETGDVKVKKK